MVKSTISQTQKPDDANTAANAIRVLINRYDNDDLEATKTALEVLEEVLAKRGFSIAQSNGAMGC